MSDAISFDRATLAKRVHQWLREQILTGQLQQGTRLQEPPIAAQLGVSITPVREALRLLYGDGLITSGERYGVRVIELTEVEIGHCFAIRRALERVALLEVAPRLSAEDKDAFLKLAKQTWEAEGQSAETLFRIDRAFHGYLVDRAGNRWLTDYLKRIGDMITVARIPLFLHPNVPETAEEHVSVAIAIRDGDINRAERLLDAHIKRVGNNAVAVQRPRQHERGNGVADLDQVG